MPSEDATEPRTGSRSLARGIWAAPLVVLVGVWLWLAFSSGGFQPRHWLPASMVLALFGVVVFLLGAYPRRLGRLSLVVLLLFVLYAVWVAASALWADSVTRVWMEAVRTGTYVVVFALALVYLTDLDARKVFRYLLVAGYLSVFILCLWRLWSADSLVDLFIENRFSYPVSYPNNAAALFLIAFWPLMWLAAGPQERPIVRGLSLGIATGLLGLTVLTQSRGAIWSLALTFVITLIVSPARLRTLLYLLIPGALLLYGFPILNRYWVEGPDVVGGGLAVRTLLIMCLAAGVVGMMPAYLERRVRIGRRAMITIRTVVLIAVIVACVYGAFAFTNSVGGPINWASQAWKQFTGQVSDTEQDASETTRLATISSSGRVDIWRVAWNGFQGAPILGVGADNFIFQYDRFRSVETSKPQHAHSIELQVLGETGVIGGILAFGAVLLALGGVMWPRCVAGWLNARRWWLRIRRDAARPEPESRVGEGRWGTHSTSFGWEMALVAGVSYWIIHASVDWLWQMAGVTLPAIMLLAAALAGVDARGNHLAPAGPVPSSVGLTRQQIHQPEDDRRSFPGSPRPSRALSSPFRVLMVTLSLLVIVCAGLPFLSLQLQRSALALARTDGAHALQRAGLAEAVFMPDPGPYHTQASIALTAAATEANSGAEDRGGAVLDNLSLSLSSHEEAIAKEPADWSLHYDAGVAALNLLLARAYAAERSPVLDYASIIPRVPGLRDWSAVAGSGTSIPEVGESAGSLASTASARDTAAYYRALSEEELATLALAFLGAAEERNPMATQVRDAIDLVQQIRYD